jgi:hypothetical protein
MTSHGGLAHAAGQILFPPERFQIAKPVRRADLAGHLRVRHVVIIEHILRLGLVDLKSGQAFVHVHDEIVGVIFAAGPFIETEVALFLDGFGGRALEDALAFLLRKLSGVMAGEIFFDLGMRPPGADDGRANSHCETSPVACRRFFAAQALSIVAGATPPAGRKAAPRQPAGTRRF